MTQELLIDFHLAITLIGILSMYAGYQLCLLRFIKWKKLGRERLVEMLVAWDESLSPQKYPTAADLEPCDFLDLPLTYAKRLNCEDLFIAKVEELTGKKYGS